MTSEPEYNYRIVPFMGSMPSGGRLKEVSKQLQDLINDGARNGWEFHSVTDVNIEVKPGCLGALIGQGPSYMRYDQVIFRKRAT